MKLTNSLYFIINIIVLSITLIIIINANRNIKHSIIQKNNYINALELSIEFKDSLLNECHKVLRKTNNTLIEANHTSEEALNLLKMCQSDYEYYINNK